MSPNFVPALIAGVSTFFFSTIFQGVEPPMAAIGGALTCLAYWLGSDFLDRKFS